MVVCEGGSFRGCVSESFRFRRLCERVFDALMLCEGGSFRGCVRGTRGAKSLDAFVVCCDMIGDESIHLVPVSRVG